MTNLQITLVCLGIAILQGYFFKFLTIQEAILIFVAFNTLINVVLPNVIQNYVTVIKVESDEEMLKFIDAEKCDSDCN